MPDLDAGLPGFTGSREFATTHWSVVVAAGQNAAPERQGALEKLCQIYWSPLYAFIRRQDYGPQDAQDLTQDFLSWLIESEHLQVADPDRGRFRSFLLARLKQFLSDERKKRRARKRGGGQPVISIDGETAEFRCRMEPMDETTPETCFERQWGLLVLERVLDRLQRRYQERGRADLYVALQPCLSGLRRPDSYAEVGAALTMSEGAVKVAVHRLRQEFGQLLRHEIAQTVADESEIDEEIRQLIRVTSR